MIFLHDILKFNCWNLITKVIFFNSLLHIESSCYNLITVVIYSHAIKWAIWWNLITVGIFTHGIQGAICWNLIFTYAIMCCADHIPTFSLYPSLLSIKGNKSTIVPIILFNFTAASQKLCRSSSKTMTHGQTRIRALGVVGMRSPFPAPEPTYSLLQLSYFAPTPSLKMRSWLQRLQFATF